MRIFVAGATGALGRQLLPKLVERGHEVTGMTRTPSKASVVEELGARAAIADALDAEEVASAVAKADPEVIVHELTAISDLGSMRNVDRTFAIDQPTAQGGDGPSPRRRKGDRCAAIRGAELRRLAV